jgi:hypothetical protein
VSRNEGGLTEGAPGRERPRVVGGRKSREGGGGVKLEEIAG